jgi:penicillin-binding protein 1A
LGQTRPSKRRLRRRVYLSAAGLLLAFVLFWAWRLVVQDLPYLGDPAQLRALNRPADVTFVARDGSPLGLRSGPSLEGTDLKALPPYVAAAFHAAIGAESDVVLSRRLAALLRPGRGSLHDLEAYVLARRLARRLPGDPLLALYLDRADFGGGALGLSAAAQTYFGKTAERLSLPEAAFLAARASGPMADPMDAAMRTEAVLERMASGRRISREALQLALATPLTLAETEGEPSEISGVLDWAAVRARDMAPGPGPLRATLALDPVAEGAAIEALRMAAAPDATIAALTADGRLAALASSHDHRFETPDRLLKPRPLGEAAAFVYRAAALAAGRSAAQVANTPMDALAEALGPGGVASLARRLGLSQSDLGAPPFADPVALASALQTFRAGGKHASPQLIVGVVDGRGRLRRPDAQNDAVEVYEPARSRQMTAMMSSPAHSAALGRPVATAAGPARDGEDAWFAGFSADAAAAVWSRPGKGAEPVWTHFMMLAHGALPVRSLDAGAAAANPRADFYGGLAADFDQLAKEADRP